MKKKIKVFILEDLKTDQTLIQRQLNKYNPANVTIIASNRSSFEEKIKWFEPDLILSDYHLPDITGLEALTYAKEHLPLAPFVYVTGILNDEAKVAEAIFKGADGFVLKDKLAMLPQVLTEVMEKHKQQHQLRLAHQDTIRQNKLLFQKLVHKIENIEQAPLREELLSISNGIEFA